MINIKLNDNIFQKLKVKTIVSVNSIYVFVIISIIFGIGSDTNVSEFSSVFAQVRDTSLSNTINSTATTTTTTTTIPSVADFNFNSSILKYKEAPSTDRQITLVAEDAELEIAPGKTVKAWTFNGTMPGPTIRMAEGENITIKFINKSPIPHTIHFHGNHDDVNDGVLPQVMPGQTYLYNITGEPAGALMYHCHAPPTSLHIRMGMYGALIVDPVDKPLPPAKEFVMVMGEYSLGDQLGFDADYYLINGYADQYMKHPLELNYGDLIRIYAINMGTTIPYPFHLHSTTFDAYPSGLWDNEPQLVQTVSIAPGDASIIEAKWKYPGTFLFHSHGIQEEHGNMGQINVIGKSGTAGDKNVLLPSEQQQQKQGQVKEDTNSNRSGSLSTPLTKSVSMFDWQYELQKSLQKPQIINYTQQKDSNNTTQTEKKQERGEDKSLQIDSNLASNITDTNNTDITLLNDANNNKSGTAEMTQHSNKNTMPVSIVPGSGNPGSEEFFNPSNLKIKPSTTVSWINDDNLPHTVTSGNLETGPTGEFDSSIINSQGEFDHTFEKQGVYGYYCTIHPWMVGQVIVS